MFPYIIFAIFAAQEEVCEIWLRWWRRIFRTRSQRKSTTVNISQSSQSIPRRPSRLFNYLYGPCRQLSYGLADEDPVHNDNLTHLYMGSRQGAWDQQDAKGYEIDDITFAPGPGPDAPKPIIARPSSRAYRNEGLLNPKFLAGFGGLSPPPRAARSRSESPSDSKRNRDVLSKTMPSLTAFGSRESADDEQRSSQITEDSRIDTNHQETDFNSSHSGLHRFSSRPPTAHSSRTFGSS